MPKTSTGKSTTGKPAGRSGKARAQAAAPDLAATVKESAQNIWLAGLGAFSKAQSEGGKVFDALVKEGHSFQRKAQGAAEQRLGDVTESMRETALELTHRAEREWGRLEQMFEERVAQALHRMGMPSTKDLHTLKARVRDLEARLEAAAAPTKAARARNEPPKAAVRRPRKAAAGGQGTP